MLRNCSIRVLYNTVCYGRILAGGVFNEKFDVHVVVNCEELLDKRSRKVREISGRTILINWLLHPNWSVSLFSQQESLELSHPSSRCILIQWMICNQLLLKSYYLSKTPHELWKVSSNISLHAKNSSLGFPSGYPYRLINFFDSDLNAINRLDEMIFILQYQILVA